MGLHWKTRNQRGVSTRWNCLRGHVCELRREESGEIFGKLHRGSCWAALPEVSLCKPSVALCASLSPSPSSEETKLDVKIEGKAWVRWDHKPSGTNPQRQPWLLQVAFAVCSQGASRELQICRAGAHSHPCTAPAWILGCGDGRVARSHGAREPRAAFHALCRAHQAQLLQPEVKL